MNPASQDDQLNIEAPLGLRLRRAREAAGLSVSEAAEKLRLKSATIESLEKEDLDALGASVYVRGYYNSYARLVGVPTVLIEGTFARRTVAAPQLHTTARVSHSRYLFDRYARRAVYVVLTASIVLPVILLATRDQLPRQGATLTPLDAPARGDTASSTRVMVPATAATAAERGVTPIAPPDRSAGDSPVMASLGPFYSQQFNAAPTIEPIAPAPIAVADPVAAGAGLSLVLRGDSWVEVVGHDGRRLEHGLLRAGTRREFAAGSVARVSLGNAEAVEVRMNGNVTDVAAFRRANVARFTVSSDGSLAPAGG